MTRLPLFLFVFFTTSINLTAQVRYYVSSANVAGPATGLSWAEAFPDLQAALAAVQAGDTVWVAGGTYKPTPGLDRTVSFNLVSGVQLFGGFAGTETQLDQRDIEANETILSGDIGVPGVRTDNSFHVVRGRALDPGTVFDGFTVTAGYSYLEFTTDPTDGLGAGMLLFGGSQQADSRPLIANCRFVDNAANEGAGMYVSWNDPTVPDYGYHPINPVLRNCRFEHNRSFENGAGLHKASMTSPGDTFEIRNCVFSENRATAGGGGGVYFFETQNSPTRLVNCLFEKDSSWYGGGVCFPATGPDWSAITLSVDSCVFQQNWADDGAGLWFDGQFELNSHMQMFCSIDNCLFDGNRIRSGDGAAYKMTAHKEDKLTARIANSVFKDNVCRSHVALIAALSSSELDIEIRNCSFLGSKSIYGPQQYASPITCAASGGASINHISTKVINCLFVGNGGGIAALSGFGNFVRTEVSNCTFMNNRVFVLAKDWDTQYLTPGGSHNDFIIDNSIIWEPNITPGYVFFNNDHSDLSAFGYQVNNILWDQPELPTNIPGFAGANTHFGDSILFGMYPEFIDTAALDFRLAECSPAVNYGNNTVLASTWPGFDLAGQPRIRFSAIDLGAYEQQDSCIMVPAYEAAASGAPGGLLCWPNPSADGALHLAWTDEKLHRDGLVRVFDLAGRPVFGAALGHGNYFQLGFLPAGRYVVTVSTPDESRYGIWQKL